MFFFDQVMISFQVSFLELPLKVSRVLGVKDVEPQLGEAALVNEARQHFGKVDVPLLCFPEQSTTSGRQGLLKLVLSHFFEDISPTVVSIHWNSH